MTRDELYETERQAYNQKLEALKNEIRTEKEAYIKGLEKGWDMMFSVVRQALAEEETKGGITMDVMEKLVELMAPTSLNFEKAVYLADYLVKNGVTVQEWTSVNDRLPEEDDSIHFYGDGRMRCTTVLAYTEYGRIIPKNRLIVKPTGNEYLDTQVTDGWEWARGTEEVTHWMPLPEPPTKEGADNG